MIKNPKFIFILILSLAALLRVIDINHNPPALYGDELTIALDSYSLLLTGHDQLGNRLPLTFSMGAGRPAGYVYASVPFVALFGPTPLGVRTLSILSGLGVIILLYLLSKRLFSPQIGLFVAFLLSISPWDISLSRGGFEAHLALFLALLGTYLFLKAKEKPSLYLLSAASFGLTLHTYPTYKLSLLLFLPLLLWFQGIKHILVAKRYFFGAVAIFLILGFLAISQTFTGGAEKRFSSINILSQDKLKSIIEQKINLERTITGLPQSFSKYFHNKPVEYAKVFIENYLQNFSIDFLVLHGDRNPRHNMATMGQIYFAEFILIGIGLLSYWQTKRRTVLFLAAWLGLAPLPTAFVDLPHALRSAFMLPPLAVLAGAGFDKLYLQKNKILLFLVGMILTIQFIFFIQKLFFLAPREYSNFWSYSAKLAANQALENKNNYDYIFLSDKIDAIEFGFPIYAKILPYQVIDQNRNLTFLNGYNFKKFENVYIGNIPDGEKKSFLDNLKKPYLYIGLPDDEKYLDDYEIINREDLLSSLLIKRSK